MEPIDILILGAGSAGFGAAYRALLSGNHRVVLVDSNPILGGTSTLGGVNNWEPGVGGKGVHFEIARRLMERGEGAVCATKPQDEFVPGHHYALSTPCDDPYESTLQRFGRTAQEFRRFQFAPQAMHEVMLELLQEADSDGRLELLLSSKFLSAETQGERITSCTVQTPAGERIFAPRMVIDCTADIVVARAVGCDHTVGEESRDTYGEIIAPEVSSRTLNGMTLCFRIDYTGTTELPEVPEAYRDVDISDWEKNFYPASCFSAYPKGGVSVNMLPTGEGDWLLRYSDAELRHILTGRVYKYWRCLVQNSGLQGWEITEIFPMLALRESYRLRGKYVLTYSDLCHGFAPSLGQAHTIAWADHPADTHGRGYSAGLKPTGLYGIPYECIVPKEYRNLLVACRGASFSHMAASSARLSRTMIALGEAAGNAAVYCLANKIDPTEVPEEAIATFVPQTP